MCAFLDSLWSALLLFQAAFLSQSHNEFHSYVPMLLNCLMNQIFQVMNSSHHDLLSDKFGLLAIPFTTRLPSSFQTSLHHSVSSFYPPHLNISTLPLFLFPPLPPQPPSLFPPLPPLPPSLFPPLPPQPPFLFPPLPLLSFPICLLFSFLLCLLFSFFHCLDLSFFLCLNLSFLLCLTFSRVHATL